MFVDVAQRPQEFCVCCLISQLIRDLFLSLSNHFCIDLRVITGVPVQETTTLARAAISRRLVLSVDELVIG